MKKYKIRNMMKFTKSNKLVIFSLGFLTVITLLWSCSKKDAMPIVLVPTITSITPAAAEIGVEVTITGTNFNTTANYNKVRFGGVVSISTSATRTSLTVLVPPGSPAGDRGVTVEAYGVATEAIAFTIIWPAPVASFCMPRYGFSGDIITINGMTFSPDLADNSVSFGGTPATVLESTGTTITVEVPAGTVTGDVTVSVVGQTSNAVTFVVPVNPATVEYLIDDSDNDAEESISRGDGSVETGSSDLELGMWDTGYTPDYGVNIVGVRHHDIAIPQGAIIISAHLQFMADDDGDDPCQVTIYGEDIGNALIFDEDIFYNISSRTRTTQSVVWDIPAWVDLDRGDAQKTPDLGDIIQAIVNRSDWVSGNAMSFQLYDSGPTANQTVDDPEGREADCGNEEKGPSLVIIYEL